LAAQPEQNEMVARKDGVNDLGYDRIVVAVHPGEERLASLHFLQQILAKFLSENSWRESFFGP
jgi:hypothetical protein